MNFRNKLEGLSLAGLSSLVQCLWVRSGAFPRVELSELAANCKLKRYIFNKNHPVVTR